MTFTEVVEENHLTVCIVSEIACPNCTRVYMLTTEPLAREIDCPACGEHSRVYPQRVRAATSRSLPRTEILSWHYFRLYA